MELLPILIAGVAAGAILLIFLGLPGGVLILALGGFSMFMGFMFIRRIVDIEV